MRFEFFVALRYLKAKRRQAVISVITVISVLGVTAGVCALVIALAINNGFREELETRLLGATANINLLRPTQDGIRQYEALTDRLSRLPHVRAAAPALYEEVLASSHARAQGMMLKGIDPRREVRVADLLSHITEGSIAGLNPAPSQPEGAKENSGDDSSPLPVTDPIIIGKELANSLGARVGDTILVTSPQGTVTPFGVVPKFHHFRVVGVFDSGFYDFDAGWAFTNLNAAQRLFDLKDVVSVIEFKIDDIYQAQSVAENIRRAAGPGFETSTWMEQNHSLFSALRLERLVTVLTIGLIMLVAALNIFITLSMMVMEKNRDIAVLRSMGARERQVWAVFTLHGLLIGGVGTGLGLLLGYGASWVCDHYRLIHLQADVYALASVPFHARPWDGIWIGVAALTISLLATIYPARAAAKLNPVEILRYE
ncbi:MAG TPA: FtsX-like permease family protein [Terriglobia bacterium]|nr:FtsX-like permease family protein [Terriglobia bacterium]